MSAAQRTPGLEEKLRVLLDPASYPSAPRRVEAIETHFAWVFLTNGYAYKLKKPMRVQRMDNTQLDTRHRSCLEELRLNRRLAPHVYLDVVALANDESGRLRVEARGRAVGWLVKMRRLPEALLLDHAIRVNTVTRASVREVARLLAEFYCQQSPVDMVADEYAQRLVDQANANRAELLADDLRARPESVGAVISRPLDFLRERTYVCAGVDAVELLWTDRPYTSPVIGSRLSGWRGGMRATQRNGQASPSGSASRQATDHSRR